LGGGWVGVVFMTSGLRKGAKVPYIWRRAKAGSHPCSPVNMSSKKGTNNLALAFPCQKKKKKRGGRGGNDCKARAGGNGKRFGGQ